MNLNEILKVVKNEMDDFEFLLSDLLKTDLKIANEVISHILSTHGKRIRPALLLISSKACGRTSKKSLLSAIAIELIHTATLMHDDLIDASKTRRGQTTVNARWGESISVLMGDHLFSKAFSILTKEDLTQIFSILIETTYLMSRGEIRQTEYKGLLSMNEETYMQIIQEKTASLFSASTKIGALLSNKSRIEQLFHYGFLWGTAFQIIDDVFDFIGSEETIGKPIASDIRKGNLTLPLIFALREAPEYDRKFAVEIISSKHIHDGGFQEIVRFVKTNGGIEYSKTKAKQLSSKAKNYISTLPQSDARKALLELADYVIDREK